MMVRVVRLLVLLGVLGSVLLVQWQGRMEAAIESPLQRFLSPVTPTTNFLPSNARTADGQLLPVAQFFPAVRCAECHQDTHAAWANSLHRNAAREPFYRESADILLKTRGIELTRHCESCHTPVALFSGALDKSALKQSAPFTPLDDEGITCSVCHSITDARLDGTGSYTIRRPALLAQADGTPIYEINQQPITNEQILADIPGHKRAVMRPLLKTPEFCATCHKVDAPPALNGYKHIRGFSAYDEWQQSGASHESLLPFYPREQRADCRACHMPKIESRNDRAAKEGKIASHQWLGANTAAPLFYGQEKQVAATKQFLQTDVADVDIFALRRTKTGELLAPLEGNAISPGEEITVEVVVSNRNAAHSFPPEVRDLYEAWVEFEALDAKGRPLFQSGFLRPNGMLDESAHVYKQIILDEQGRQITRHQIWTTNLKAYDNAIPPGRSDVARYSFRVPDCEMRSGDCGASVMTLRAKLNYRRFNQEYTNYVLTRQKKQMTVPVITMAEAVVSCQLSVVSNNKPLTTNPQSAIRNPHWKRWNDYGIGLYEQTLFGAAAEAFRQAAALKPDDPMLLVNIAIAEMATERLDPELEQYRKAEALLKRALELALNHARARFYRAQIWRTQGRMKEAAAEFQQLATQYPRDREVLRQWGQTLFALGQYPAARTSFEAILRIDPTDFLSWQSLTSLYLSEGRQADSEQAQRLYWQWRDDPNADAVAAKFFVAHPEWAEERVRSHTHRQQSALRPVLTGVQANPDK